MDRIEEKYYTERADDIEDEDLERWNVKSELYDRVQKKLTQKGAKLIVGPRGTGKTHQMKIAYKECLANRKKPFPVYVSVGKYFHLEPYLHKTPIAKTIFHTWVLARILKGCFQFLDDSRLDVELDCPLSEDEIEDFISQAEKHSNIVKDSEAVKLVTINSVVSVIEELLFASNRKSCVILLDDAALNLTPEYMIEFFDVFRSLKTARISPKASVYPTTDTGPRCHVKQDFEPVSAWLSVDDPQYDEFLDELTRKRLGHIEQSVPKNVLELLKLVSFGIPRAFINLVRSFEESSAKTVQQKFNETIDEQARAIEREYLSLDQKMPQYATIIKTGLELFESIIQVVTETNSKLEKEKQLCIGIDQDGKQKLEKMVNFLKEAGLLYEKGSPQRHGEGRIYDQFIPHLLFLVKNRAFSEKRGFKPEQILSFMERPSKKHFIRRKYTSLLSAEKIKGIGLDLPPCAHCGTPRLMERQKFCHNCGRPLTEKSAYKRCMAIPVEKLPISDFQIKSILENTSIRKVEDFFIKQDIGSELQKAHRIGPKKSDQIFEKVKSYVESEFLA